MQALAGGGIISLAVAMMLLGLGRIAGISGILNETLHWKSKREAWRTWFIAGLILGGTILQKVMPDVFTATSEASLKKFALAGLLVGFGTVMSGGCTSGHGICGVSRFSPRSIVATCVFIFFGFITVTLMRMFGVTT